jgi:hypothetical protein
MFRGGCLCGAVRYEVSGEPQFVVHCYCEDCRRESGSDHLTHMAVPDAAVKFNGAPKEFSKPGTSGDIVRLFCGECGSTLLGRPSSMPGVSNVRTGTLDDVSGLTPRFAVFCSRVRGWTRVDPEVTQFAELPPRSS